MDYIQGAESAVGKFINYFVDKKFYGYTFIAHNQTFDCTLLLRQLLARGLRVEPVFDGCKIILLRIPPLKIDFVDSLKYIKLPLSKFASRFRFTDSRVETGKGVFPYKCNRPEYYDYVGRTPTREMFLDLKTSPEEKVAQVDQFLLEQGERDWIFRDEMHRYLEVDVLLLRYGVTSLIREFAEFQDEIAPSPPALPMNCFTRPYFTLASFIFALWRMYSMPPGSIYLLENQTGAVKTSYLEIEWLEYRAHKTATDIRHAFNHPEGQKKIGKYRVDGFSEPGVVYEFLGCIFHYHSPEQGDCPISRHCAPNDRGPYGKLLCECYSDWKGKEQALKKQGFQVIYIWECEFKRAKETCAELVDFLASRRGNGPKERLVLRDGLRGGRVESLRLVHQSGDSDQELCFVDKISLYPHVSIVEQYPVGKPENYLGKKLEKVSFVSTPVPGFFRKIDGQKMVGLVQASILPPDSIFLPLLPVSHNEKLMFVLCTRCMKEGANKLCTHNDEDRCLRATWTTPEVEYAVQCGYKVVEIYELVLYSQTSYLFRDFYTKVARIKIGAGGFPDDVVEAGEKKMYLDNLNQKMPGLNLSESYMSRNPSRRQFGKDVSTHGLGKLSQSDSRKNCKYVSNWAELSAIRYNPRYELLDINPVTSTFAEVSFKTDPHFVGFHRNTNAVCYSFVTAFGRVAMAKDMRELQKIGCKLYYTDTDSILFSVSPDRKSEAEKILATNSAAYGDYKYETREEIVSYCSLGPKNYSFALASGEQVVKVRGFTLRSTYMKNLIGHESMRDMVLSWHKDRRKITLSGVSDQMKFDKTKQTVTSVLVGKTYRNDTFDKRFISDDERAGKNLVTLPFGLKHCHFADCP